MYSELCEFLAATKADARRWRDGEFATALAVAAVAGVWLWFQPNQATGIRAHFGDLLTFIGILFGFSLTSLFFYIQAASVWSEDSAVQEVAKRLVDDHVWALLSMLALIGYILMLWAAPPPSCLPKPTACGTYSLLFFLVAYCGGQILNQVLTVRWAFRRRQRLLTKPASKPTDSHDPRAL